MGENAYRNDQYCSLACKHARLGGGGAARNDVGLGLVAVDAEQLREDAKVGRRAGVEHGEALRKFARS